MEPEYGFVEPPSLKPDVRPLSIEDYLATEYIINDDYTFLIIYLLKYVTRL